jgi:hypothetical protein
MWVTIEKPTNTVAIVEAKLRLLVRWLGADIRSGNQFLPH